MPNFFRLDTNLSEKIIKVHWTGNTFNTSWDPDSWGVRPGYAFKLFPPSCHQETNVKSQNKSHWNQRGKRMAEQGDLFEVQGSCFEIKSSYIRDFLQWIFESHNIGIIKIRSFLSTEAHVRYIHFAKFIYCEKATTFSPNFWLALHRTKVRWRFRKILRLSQNIWTLICRMKRKVKLS